MSIEKFDENCPGCKPMILNTETGEPLPDDHAMMVILNGILGKNNSEKRKIYHKVMCQNSRDPKDLAVIQNVMEEMKTAMANRN